MNTWDNYEEYVGGRLKYRCTWIPLPVPEKDEAEEEEEEMSTDIEQSLGNDKMSAGSILNMVWMSLEGGNSSLHYPLNSASLLRSNMV